MPGYGPPLYCHEFGENYDDETWHHLVVSRDSDSIDVYVDAQYVDSMSIDISWDIEYDQSSQIGGIIEVVTQHLNYCLMGAIDELRVYNRVLEYIEIQQLASGEPSPAELKGKAIEKAIFMLSRPSLKFNSRGPVRKGFTVDHDCAAHHRGLCEFLCNPGDSL